MFKVGVKARTIAAVIWRSRSARFALSLSSIEFITDAVKDGIDASKIDLMLGVASSSTFGDGGLF